MTEALQVEAVFVDSPKRWLVPRCADCGRELTKETLWWHCPGQPGAHRTSLDELLALLGSDDGVATR